MFNMPSNQSMYLHLIHGQNVLRNLLLFLGMSKLSNHIGLEACDSRPRSMNFYMVILKVLDEISHAQKVTKILG